MLMVTPAFSPPSINAPVGPTAPAANAPPDLEKVRAILAKDDIVSARKALLSLDKTTRDGLLVNPPPGGGLGPILDAASRGAAHMIALYAGLGASLDVRTMEGFNAVYQALFKRNEEAARTLITSRATKEPMIERKPVTVAQIERQLETTAWPASDTHLDRIATELTNYSSLQLNRSDALNIYVCNVHALKESPNIRNCEAWNTQSVFAFRMRTLLQMLNEPLTPGDRAAIIREIAICSETIYLDQRIFAAADAKSPEIADLVRDYECDNIMAKLNGIYERDEGMPLVVPVSTPTHAMYLTLETKNVDGKPHVIVHFDNLGEGNEIHTRDASKRVYPLRVSIPMNAESCDHVTDLVRELMGQRGSGTIPSTYATITRWYTQVMNDVGVLAIEDAADRGEEAHWPQDAGNCTLANTNPGLDRRFGPELAARFHAFEEGEALRRWDASNSLDRLKIAIAANKTRIEENHRKLAAG